jgi:hypothetical protein
MKQKGKHIGGKWIFSFESEKSLVIQTTRFKSLTISEGKEEQL